MNLKNIYIIVKEFKQKDILIIKKYKKTTDKKIHLIKLSKMKYYIKRNNNVLL